MLEGIHVSNEAIVEVALVKVATLSRENVMMEAALNEAHKELDRLRSLIPSDEEVTEDATIEDVPTG